MPENLVSERGCQLAIKSGLTEVSSPATPRGIDLMTNIYGGKAIPGVGNYFTRRARFGKTVKAAGRTLIGKQGEDLSFLKITVHVRM